MEKTKKNWGFDTRNMDLSIRPQDDFYRYANGGWLKKNKIPADEARWGSFLTLRHDTDKKLKNLLENISRKTRLKTGSVEQQVRDLYLSAMDIKSRNKLGTKPLHSLRKEIRDIKNKKDLLLVISHFERIGISAPWGLLVDQDSKNSSRYVLHIHQSGLGLPDKEYYLKDEPEFLRVRTAYSTHLKKIFTLLGYTKSEAAKHTSTVLSVEKKLAHISMDKIDVRDAEKTYHKKTITELKRFAPEIEWDTYFAHAHIPKISYVILAQPEFLKKAGMLLSQIPLEEWKTYLEWHLVTSTSSFLSAAFIRANFEFYGKTLVGTKKMKPEWRRALGVVNGILGEPFGKIYVAHYFTQSAKKKMDTLVSDLFRVYERRIKNLDWMSSKTKKQAVQKLRMMERKIGYPKRFKKYTSLKIQSNDFFGNVLRAIDFQHKRSMRKLSKPIDRHEWHMTPQTVNAYCNFNMNEIVFPAAILQHPFFDSEADDAVNYGAIGSVIGHEMTHGFDDQGAKFDGRGNMKSWWTKQDLDRFNKKGRALVAEYNTYTVADNIHVNGQLTLGENIADLGGLVIAYDAYQERLKKTGKKIIDGFTPEERFFLGAAQAECELVRNEYIKMAVLNDPHSPGEYRINGPLQNIPEFQSTYKVKRGDKRHRHKQKQVKIW